MRPQNTQPPYPPIPASQTDKYFDDAGGFFSGLPIPTRKIFILILKICGWGALVVGAINALLVWQAIPNYTSTSRVIAGMFEGVYIFLRAVAVGAFLHVIAGMAENLIRIKDRLSVEKT